VIVKKAVILAGGFGTRLSEETGLRPKPLIEIGGAPILWHIMKIYHQQGIKEFVICLGYKGYLIKEFFANYLLHRSDVTLDFSTDSITYHNRRTEDWKIDLIDTGEATMTGGRLKRVAPLLDDGPFCMTYGDGLADINLDALIDHHVTHGLKATVTSVRPPGRFGALDLDDNGHVSGFTEKPRGDGGLINGGFFVLSPEVFDVIDGDETVWEGKPMETLAKSGQLSAFRHDGFWHPMDTLRDKTYLEELWRTGQSPWKRW
jgi:glucose-1-phosphate cytidylyltransferase